MIGLCSFLRSLLYSSFLPKKPYCLLMGLLQYKPCFNKVFIFIFFYLAGTTAAATTTMAMSQFTVVPTTIALGTGAAALNPASLGLGLAALGILG